jgi:hypothetical protein
MKNSLAVLLVLIAVLVSSSATYFARNSETVTRTATLTSPTTTTSSGSLFSQFTTFTTVTRTTLPLGGSTYSITTGEYSGCIPPVQCYLTTVTTRINSQSSQLYQLTFNQTDVCTNFGTLIPWSVILMTSEGTYNVTEPSNSSIPLSECCDTAGSLAYSSIVFSVPNGTYSYVTHGFTTTTGNVTVMGQDVTVIITVHPASCGTSTTTSSTSTNTVTDNFENSSLTFLIWSNNTSVQNPISNIAILTNNTVSCQVVRFDVNPMSYVFIHPALAVNNNGSFFGLTYANGTQVSYLANESQDFYYTDGTVSGIIDMTFTLPAHGSCV